MAASLPSRFPLLGALLGALLAWAGVGAATYDSTAPIDLEAASSDFDYRNDTLLFRRVKITQGPLQVEAEEARATGLNFENSKWDLVGQVSITLPDGRLAAEQATVSFRDNAVAQAEVRGSPATFEQRLKDTRQLAKGHARTIFYDVRAGTVSLSGDAWLSDGQSEIRGDTLVYDIGRQRVAANPGATRPGGVRITINPKDRAGTGPAPPPPPQDRSP
jgi:lipopolysaccharide transport protein LptA